MLKAGVVQITTCKGIKLNAEKIVGYMELAAKEGIDILCFPECSLTGYIRDFYEVAKEEVEEALNLIHSIAVKNEVNVILGTPYFVEDRIFNSAALLLTDNSRAIYHKNTLTSFDEKYFLKGEEILTFNIKGVKCGVLICRDQNDPSLARKCVEGGARVIFILAAHYYPPPEAWLKFDKNKALPIARAVENHIYVFKANTVGSQAETISLGGSLIVNPDGLVIQEGDKTGEAVLSYQIP